ncbi:MAG: hypothetical protein KGS61_16220 [Verrucomicrobia bacterium]|nr:hypothetical protein [Verrucomicrobiota bacterium]
MTRGERPMLILFALALFGLLTWIGGEAWQARRFAQRQRLPDGSIVELRAVTFGRIHRCFSGTVAQRLLRKFAPARLGRWIGGAEIQHQGPKDSLIFWIAHRPGGGHWFAGRGAVAVTINDRGQEGEMGDWVAPFRGESEDLDAIELADFGRQDKTIRLRIYADGGQQRTRLAEFKAPNPLF